MNVAVEKNSQGGLNLSWAVRQSLDKLGIDAKVSEVRLDIEKTYGKLGKKALLNEGSFNSAVTVMRKKLRGELGKVPPVPVESKIAQTVGRGERTKPPLKEFKLHVIGTLSPALQRVAAAEFAAGGADELAKALTLVAAAEKELGGRDKVQALIAAFS